MPKLYNYFLEGINKKMKARFKGKIYKRDASLGGGRGREGREGGSLGVKKVADDDGLKDKTPKTG